MRGRCPEQLVLSARIFESKCTGKFVSLGNLRKVSLTQIELFSRTVAARFPTTDLCICIKRISDFASPRSSPWNRCSCDVTRNAKHSVFVLLSVFVFLFCFVLFCHVLFVLFCSDPPNTMCHNQTRSCDETRSAKHVSTTVLLRWGMILMFLSMSVQYDTYALCVSPMRGEVVRH